MRFSRSVLLVVATALMAGCNIVESRKPFIHSSACLVTQNGYFREGFSVSARENDRARRSSLGLLRALREEAGQTGKVEVIKFVRLFTSEIEKTIQDSKYKANLIKLNSGIGAAEKRQIAAFMKSPRADQILRDLGRQVATLGKGRKKANGVGVFFTTSDGCQENIFKVDPSTMTAKKYKEIGDPVVSAKFYQYKNFKNSLYVRQVFRKSEKYTPYAYDFIFPKGDNRFVVYEVRGRKLLVMAIYGHVYYDDWRPIAGEAGADENPFSEDSGLEKNNIRYVKIDRKLDGIEGDYPEALVISMRENAFEFSIGRRKKKHREVSARKATPKMVNRLVYLFREIEEGRVRVSRKMKRDFQRREFTFLPDG